MSSPAHFTKKKARRHPGDVWGLQWLLYICIHLDMCTNNNDNRDSKRPQATERDHRAVIGVAIKDSMRQNSRLIPKTF